jgi:hypothetical protein
VAVAAAAAAAAAGVGGSEEVNVNPIRGGRTMRAGVFAWIAFGLCAAAFVASSTAGGDEAKGAKIFPTKEEAMAALVDALSKNDDEALKALAGPETDDIVQSGKDPLVQAERLRVAALAKSKIEYETLDDGTVVPNLGQTSWPLPIPLVQDAGGWRFDAKTAREEILARRIGTNELRVMEILRDLVDAQKVYKAKDHDGDGVLEYAQKFISSEGTHDGLWWPPTPGEKDEDRSPLGAALSGVVEAAASGASKDKPFSGYRWKLLTEQGPSAPGGAFAFKEGENLTKGFAVLAVPADRGTTGMLSFIISHHGRLLDKDLGEKGLELYEQMTVFEPDLTWKRIPPPSDTDDAAPAAPTAGGAPGGWCPPLR